MPAGTERQRASWLFTSRLPRLLSCFFVLCFRSLGETFVWFNTKRLSQRRNRDVAELYRLVVRIE
jgi:hypothetical protein